MRNLTRILLGISLLTSTTAILWAAGGTSNIASKGSKASLSPGWPLGVESIVNDPARTVGYNSWFSEWSNDVNQYVYEINSMEDVNRLIEKLANVKESLVQLRLNPMKAPEGFGWVSRFPEGNSIAVVFSIGDQERVNQWYARVRKPFGKIEFVDVPVAVPPTLTIFVQHKLIDLEKLKVPENVVVEPGYIPTVFHKLNSKREAEQAKAPQKPTLAPQAKLDPETQQTAEKIAAFLAQRNQKSN